MNEALRDSLRERIARGIDREIDPAVRAFAERLAQQQGALAALFYGSNLRTGELEGVLDYYLLMPGSPERGLWPRVSYHEWSREGVQLRAKVATMTLARFAEAASGELLDTTIWARFVQPSALIWCKDDAARGTVVASLGQASMVAARLAVACGPASGTEADYWTALFEATYAAEFRMETTSRARSIIELNKAHFDGLLPLALDATGIGYAVQGECIAPAMSLASAAHHPAMVETAAAGGKAIEPATAGPRGIDLRGRGALCRLENRTPHRGCNRGDAMAREASAARRTGSDAVGLAREAEAGLIYIYRIWIRIAFTPEPTAIAVFL